MYKKILVPLDGSSLAERAVIHAGEIARETRAEIILLQAVHVPLPVVPESSMLTEGKVLEEAAGIALDYLERIGAELHAEGLNIRTVIDERPPLDAILHVAERENVDLILMSTHGRHGLSRLVMGSIAESVLHATDRPILLIKPERPIVRGNAAEDRPARPA